MYPAKILLFGEYTVFLNSYALAIPFGRFNGEWAFINENPDHISDRSILSNKNLKDFLKYLKLTAKKQKLKYSLDIDVFEKDIENGLYFNSNVPVGDGLGSSGSLVAAIFDRYVKSPVNKNNLSDLRNCLAEFESFFHGKSSGIDPLVSYLNQPLTINRDNKLEKLNIPVNYVLRKYGIFLVHTRQNAKTSGLVNYFNNRCKSDSGYFTLIKKQYIPINNKCVTTLIELKDTNRFFSIIQELTALQLKIFKEMIPENFYPIINYGLESNLFYMKLCGSGGGGYFIGFTNSPEETQSFFKLNEYENLPLNL
jgi:mevalonate kinase